MGDEYRRMEMSDDVEEAWTRIPPDPLGSMEAYRFEGGVDWRVVISMAEFVREEPLESEMRRGVAEALRGVPGVTKVFEEDREQWLIEGSPSGEDLLQACAPVIDALADRARPLAE